VYDSDEPREIEQGVGWSGFGIPRCTTPHAYLYVLTSLLPLCDITSLTLSPPFFQTGIVGPHVKHGIKLLGNGKNFLNTPLHLEVTMASKSAIAAVEKVRCW
jgi:hypothetical protein